jgi:hypothetical protein
VNCLDYRRTLLAGECESAPMKAHRVRCAACAGLAREHEALEQELRRALEVPVPPGLEASLSRGVVLRRRGFLAAAAVSVLAAGAGAYAWLGRADPLAMACIDFVMKEEAKSIMMGAMPRAEARAALAGMLPLEKLESMGRVRHVGPCPFNGVMAYHVVLGVPQGKLTLLVMPSSVAGIRRATEHGMHARVVPLRNGSVGIVGAEAAVVESMAGALRAA